MNVLLERTVCPACNAKDSRSLFRARFVDPKMKKFIERKFVNPPMILELLTDGEYELRKCAACTLIYQRNVLTDEYTGKLYDEWLLSADAEHELSKERLPANQLAYFANEIRTIGRLLKKPPHETKLLDYGLGRGWWCRMATAFGFDAWGTDLASNLVAEARGKGINAMELQDLAPEQFDFINTEQVFEHLARPLEVLKQLKQLLRPKGMIKISVPEGRGFERRIPLMDWTAQRWSKRYLLPATPLIHINTFTRASIAAMGACAGMHAIKVPLHYEYSLVDASNLKSVGRSLLRPLYRRAAASTYVFLQS
jgi:2-polyprenyl-3-methyl-5-hydroxy-6-metoxy-1,4-benzoquinol methylase